MFTWVVDDSQNFRNLLLHNNTVLLSTEAVNATAQHHLVHRNTEINSIPGIAYGEAVLVRKP